MNAIAGNVARRGPWKGIRPCVSQPSKAARSSSITQPAAAPEHPLVICLHGFPEYWAAWSAVMLELADTYHLVAPDQRGFNLSFRPQDVGAYQARHIVRDLALFADHLSPERPFILAGHDWGASIAYAYAFSHPHRLTHLIIANGVHPVPFQRAILEDPQQRRASQYINLFRQPDAAAWLSDNEFAAMFRMLASFSDIGWMRKAQHSAYVEAWSRPGAMQAMLNWYCASPLIVPEPDETVATAPILELPPKCLASRCRIWWSGAAMTGRCCHRAWRGWSSFAPDLTVRELAGCGHWLLHQQPAAVAREIRSFLGARR